MSQPRLRVRYDLENKQEKLRREISQVQSLVTEGKSLSQIGKELGKSLTWVTARLKLIQAEKISQID